MPNTCSIQRAAQRPETPATGAAVRAERVVSRASAVQPPKAG